MSISGSRPVNRRILSVAIILALLAFGGTLYILKGSGGGSVTKVLVAKSDLHAGTKLSADSVQVVDASTSSVPNNAYVDPRQVVDKTLAIDVPQNSPMTPTQFLTPGSAISRVATGGSNLDITPGYVTLTIPAATTFTQPPNTQPFTLTGLSSDLVSNGFFIQPNDHIDILVAIPTANGPVIRYGFQDVRVLKVGDSGTATTAVPTTYLIELPRSQAEAMLQLVNVTCNPASPTPCNSPTIVKYVLRPACEAGDRNYATDVKTLKGQCGINPYPNYLPTTNTEIPSVQDPGSSPQTAIQGLLQTP